MGVFSTATVSPMGNATAALDVKWDHVRRIFDQEVHSVDKNVR